MSTPLKKFDGKAGIEPAGAGTPPLPSPPPRLGVTKTDSISRVTIPRVWRSELVRLGLFGISTGAATLLSFKFPGTVITGEFFRFGTYQLMLHLPLFWLIPATFFLEAAYQIYNVRYQIDRDGLICRVGIISFKQTITRIRYEDIRSIESDQTIIDRFLDVGDIQIGTAATGHVDVVLTGIGQPSRVREVIQAERERKIKGSTRKVAQDSEPKKQVANSDVVSSRPQPPPPPASPVRRSGPGKKMVI